MIENKYYVDNIGLHPRGHREEQSKKWNYGEAILIQSSHYSMSIRRKLDCSNSPTLLSLLDKYGNLIWNSDQHRRNCFSFIEEISSISLKCEYSFFTNEFIIFLIDHLKENRNKNSTINRKISALSKLLRKSVKMKEIPYFPNVKKLKENEGRIRFLSHEEEVSIFSEIDKISHLYYNLCIFLIDTGARFSEATSLSWNDIFEGRVTFWITKSGKSRTVPLTNRAKNALKESPGKMGPFSSVKKHAFRNAWLKAKKNSICDSDINIVPHVLRHTCASRLVQAGVDIRRVQTWLGHENLKMTLRYAHLAPNDLDLCVKILEDFDLYEI